MKVYSFELNLDWQLVKSMIQIDRFDAFWGSLEKKEGQSLKQVTHVISMESRLYV